MAEYIERDALIERIDGIWDCADMVFDPNDKCCRTDDCASCKWRETKNAIRKIVAYIPAADARPVEWIPVTERLPKEGEFVLVYGDLYPNKHDGGVIAVSKRMDWNYWQGFGRERNITHWMPLPQPPKEE